MELEREIFEIKKQGDFLAICAAPKGVDWRGVYRATINLFPGKVVAIPAVVYEKPEKLNSIFAIMLKAGFREICLSGFPLRFFSLFDLKKSETKISAIFHGTFTEFTGPNNSSIVFSGMISHALNGNIFKVGVIRAGLDIQVKKIFGIEALQLHLPPPSEKIINELKGNLKKEEGINIGVFGNHNFNKNIFNQVVGALLVPDAKVHILHHEPTKSFFNNDRIIMHKNLYGYPDFLRLLHSMSINSYVSFSESWGQIFVESLAMEVPCITNVSSSVINLIKEQRNFLGVEEPERPQCIAEKIEFLLQNRDKWLRICNEGTAAIRAAYEISVNKFLTYR